MVRLNAHFDGNVIIPDEPTGLTAGTRLRVTLESIVEPSSEPAAANRFEPLNIQISPELSTAIAADPEFSIQES